MAPNFWLVPNAIHLRQSIRQNWAIEFEWINNFIDWMKSIVSKLTSNSPELEIWLFVNWLKKQMWIGPDENNLFLNSEHEKKIKEFEFNRKLNNLKLKEWFNDFLKLFKKFKEIVNKNDKKSNFLNNVDWYLKESNFSENEKSIFKSFIWEIEKNFDISWENAKSQEERKWLRFTNLVKFCERNLVNN